MVKMKRPLIKKELPPGLFVCNGCGYEYDPDKAILLVKSNQERSLRTCRKIGPA